MAKICLAVKRKPEYEAVVNAKLPGHRLTWLEDLSEQERRQEILGCDALVVTIRPSRPARTSSTFPLCPTTL